MTADIEMLPLPEYLYGREASDNERVVTVADAHAYAVRNVAHATEPLKAEIESLRAELREMRRTMAGEFKRAERLAEALRELRDLMLGQVKWMPCDCGCPQQRTPDGPHSVTWLRAAQQVEIAIGKAEGKE